MTITPFDFAVLIGLGFHRRVVSLSGGFSCSSGSTPSSLWANAGFTPPGDHFSDSILEDLMNDDERWAQHSSDQQSQLILPFLLGMSIFANLSNHYHFYYLVNFVDLDRVRYLN